MAKRVKDMDVFGGLGMQQQQPETQAVPTQQVQQADTQEAYTTELHNTDTQQWVVTPQKQETRSKRVQVVFTPTLLKAVDKEAKRCGVSRNELIHQVLSKYLEGRG